MVPSAVIDNPDRPPKRLSFESSRKALNSSNSPKRFRSGSLESTSMDLISTSLRGAAFSPNEGRKHAADDIRLTSSRPISRTGGLLRAMIDRNKMQRNTDKLTGTAVSSLRFL